MQKPSSPRDYFDFLLGIKRQPPPAPQPMVPPMAQPPQPTAPAKKPIDRTKLGHG
jgi:hypothetical protein